MHKHHEHVSQSCPNLSEWPVLSKKEEYEEGGRRRGSSFLGENQLRRRAYSENISGPFPFHKVNDF